MPCQCLPLRRTPAGGRQPGTGPRGAQCGSNGLNCTGLLCRLATCRQASWSILAILSVLATRAMCIARFQHVLPPAKQLYHARSSNSNTRQHRRSPRSSSPIKLDQGSSILHFACSRFQRRPCMQRGWTVFAVLQNPRADAASPQPSDGGQAAVFWCSAVLELSAAPTAACTSAAAHFGSSLPARS